MTTTRESLRRLSNYRSVLYKLKSLGFVKVFSDNLADALGLSAAQVRKDFAAYGLTGNKKGGYLVDDLLAKLKKILGKDKVQRVIVVGCGRMGSAILNYSGFAAEGIKVVAGFDSSPSLIDTRSSIPVLELGNLEEVIRREKIEVAVVTVPEAAAAQVCELLQSVGIKGILNLAPVQLRSTDDCIVHNMNIVLELENMFFFVKAMKKDV